MINVKTFNKKKNRIDNTFSCWGCATVETTDVVVVVVPEIIFK